MILPAGKIAQCLGLSQSADDNTSLSILLTDSRDLTFADKTVFFALRTDVNDGHNYINALYRKGVRYFVVEKDYQNSDCADATFWRVDNVMDALRRLAADVRQHFHIPVIGITGSRGKTVVKEYLYHLLRNDFDIARSPRSYNSQIGVPLSVWEMQPSTTLAIFEAGISQPGEMEALQQIIRPTIGIFTSLTDEHSADFQSISQKAKEKALLFKNCDTVYYSASDSNADMMRDAIAQANPKAHTIGVEGDARDLAIAVANSLIAKEQLTLTRKKASPRIDVCETLKNCLIIFDGYTNDLRSVADALNFATRHTAANRSLTMILQWPISTLSDKDTISYLQRLAVAKGVQRLIGIGFPQAALEETTDMPMQFEQVDDIDAFLHSYSISDFNDEAILIKGDVNQGSEKIKTLLEAPRHETVMEVDLGAITKNFNFYRSKLKPETGLIAMVKAAGYGIGAVELSKTLQNQGAAYLAVAVVDEGAELRRAGITMPIIVMNPMGTNYDALFENKLEPSVFSLRELNLLLDNASRLGIKDYPVHIKLDTGMHRLGFLPEELDALISALKAQNTVKVASIFSHLATADCLDQDEYTELQLRTFAEMSNKLIAAMPYPIKRHILNTAGIMRYPQHQYNFARLGIGLYGVSPIEAEKNKLQVVARLFTRIISLKNWNEGITIGYGRKGKVAKPSVIATIPIGYADGLDRHLSNGAASFIVNGVACPVIGNICMDQCMIDVTDANASIGDRVEIFGENAPIERLSDTLGTIPYEILTSISPRVKRIYYRD